MSIETVKFILDFFSDGTHFFALCVLFALLVGNAR